MDQHEKVEVRKKLLTCNKVSSSVAEIDQLCNLIDQNTFGLRTSSSTKFDSVPPNEVKIFRSSRVKRLQTSSIAKSNRNKHDNASLFPSMNVSLSSSLLKRFRSLSTDNTPQTRRCPSRPIDLFRMKSTLSSINEEELKPSTTQTHLSCAIGDTCRATANSCNVEELAAYLDNFLYLPKSLSGAAELMYT